jgi:F-type H+-transporting ATPase subunit b
MLIDWFTVGAQVLNFLILVWLMKRFLYHPLLHAIDSREKRIAAQITEADTRRSEAKKERNAFQRRNEEFDQERAGLLTKVTIEADAVKKRLLDEARAAADAMSSKRLETLQKEAASLNQALARRTQDEVFGITRKVLAELAGVELQERATAVFLEKLQALTEPAKSELGQALGSSNSPAIVRSAFKLSDPERAKIQTTLEKTFPAKITLDFKTTPDLVSGIELTAHGHKIAWSIDDYLLSLEKQVETLLQARTAPDS